MFFFCFVFLFLLLFFSEGLVLQHLLRGVNLVVILALFVSFYTCGFIADQTHTVN